MLLHSGKFAKVPFINGGEYTIGCLGCRLLISRGLVFIAQLDEGTVFVNGTSAKTDQDVVNWLTARFPGLTFGITNTTAVRELLKYYPDSLAAGSPYNTGNETFGQGPQYKRFASIVGDLTFQVSYEHHFAPITIYTLF